MHEGQSQFSGARDNGTESDAATSATVESAFNEAPLAMLVVDGDGAILEANSAIVDLLGREPDDVVGRVGGEGIGCPHAAEKGCGHGELCRTCPLRAAVVKAVQACVGEDLDFDRARDIDGRQRSLRVNVVPVTGPNGAPHALMVLRDLSALRRRNTELENLVKARDMLLRVVAHDLGSPLTGVFAGLEALLNNMERMRSAAVRELLETMRDSVKEQIDLIGRLLDYARIQTDPGRVRLEPIAVRPAIEASIDTLAPAARARNVTLKTQFDGEPHSVRADTELLMGVLRNLLDNAIKYTPSGGTIALAVSYDGETVLFEVRDTGCGIEPEAARSLEITGAAPTRADTASGSGLGLPFVKAALEAQGARLRVESEPGKGSRFAFELPVAQTETTSG